MLHILTESCMPETKETTISSVDNGVNDVRKGTRANLRLEKNIAVMILFVAVMLFIQI